MEPGTSLEAGGAYSRASSSFFFFLLHTMRGTRQQMSRTTTARPTAAPTPMAAALVSLPRNENGFIADAVLEIAPVTSIVAFFAV